MHMCCAEAHCGNCGHVTGRLLGEPCGNCGVSGHKYVHDAYEELGWPAASPRGCKGVSQTASMGTIETSTASQHFLAQKETGVDS